MQEPGTVSLRPASYRSRVADATVARLLAAVGAVLIEGPKWCGKTWTGLNHARSALWVADPAQDYLVRSVARADPQSALEGEQPRLVDEWQDAPGLWDAVRLGLDRRPGIGQFILTGSSTPRDDVISHSGTGRIVRTAMLPMSLIESGDSTGTVSLARLLAGERPGTAVSGLSDQKVAELVCRGGWPGLLGLATEDAMSLTRGYLSALEHSDASRIDGIRRNPDRLHALIMSLARNTATLVANTTLACDMADNAPSPKTMADHLDVLRRLHVLCELPAWAPALRSPVRLQQRPKRMLVDPSLAAAALDADPDRLIGDRKTLGLFFENLCLRDLKVYTEAASGRVFHYHDNSGLEVDAITVLPGGVWAGWEIKLGADREDMAAANLIRLRNKMAAGGQPAPAALVILTGAGTFAHTRADGVSVVPVDTLGP